MLLVILLLLLWRSVDLLISVVTPYFIPYLGFFAYADNVTKYNLPDYITALANFDGIYYIRIALQGYEQYEQAFFPLYPLLIHALNPVFGFNPVITGIVISNVAFALALYILKQYLQLLQFTSKRIVWVISLLLAYPTSFFFGVMYTESIFLLFLLSSLFFLHKKKFILAFLFGYLASVTRLIGVFLVVPFVFYLLSHLRVWNKKQLIQEWKKYILYLFVSLAPIIGLASYSYFLWQTTGDPLFFFSAQEYFGAQRSTNLILPPQVVYRYIKIFITADWNFQYFVAVIEFVFFVFISIVLLIDLVRLVRAKKWQYPLIGINLFSWINLLIPTLTGTFTSIPRYSLLSIAIFFALSELQSKTLKIFLLVIFFLLHIVMLALFIQGYYVT